MMFNVFLAMLAVAFGWMMLFIKNRLLFGILLVLWVLFLPNTIYILTDVIHIPYQLQNIPQILVPYVVMQYLLLGICAIVTFLLGIYPIEFLLITKRFHLNKRRKVTFVLLFNALIAFGVVIGRFQRTNSWEVFTNPLKVIQDFINIFILYDVIPVVFMAFLIIQCTLYLLARPYFLKTVHHHQRSRSTSTRKS